MGNSKHSSLRLGELEQPETWRGMGSRGGGSQRWRYSGANPAQYLTDRKLATLLRTKWNNIFFYKAHITVSYMLPS